MSIFLWVAASMALWAFFWWVVLPWHLKRSVRKGLADWQADERRKRSRKSCDYDPTDPGMNRGYDPSREKEEVMHPAMKSFLAYSLGIAIGTAFMICVIPDDALMFLRNFVLFEAMVGAGCFFCRNSHD